MAPAPKDIARATLPPGRHRLPREFVAAHQRNRLRAALVALVDEQGYPATSLNQIVKVAGISRTTFYEHFADREDLFLSVLDDASERAIRATCQAAEAWQGSWEAKVQAGLAALLAEIDANPPLARVCLIEALSATPEALARYESTIDRFGTIFRPGRAQVRGGADLPDALEDIVVGGIVWTLGKRLTAGPAAGPVTELLPDLVEFALSPYLGANARTAVQP